MLFELSNSPPHRLYILSWNADPCHQCSFRPSHYLRQIIHLLSFVMAFSSNTILKYLFCYQRDLTTKKLWAGAHTFILMLECEEEHKFLSRGAYRILRIIDRLPDSQKPALCERNTHVQIGVRNSHWISFSRQWHPLPCYMIFSNPPLKVVHILVLPEIIRPQKNVIKRSNTPPSVVTLNFPCIISSISLKE